MAIGFYAGPRNNGTRAAADGYEGGYAGGYEGYTTHAATTYTDPGPGIDDCFDNEGGASCKQRCDGDSACRMFGLYRNGTLAGRCCLKVYGPEVGEESWGEGSTFVKSRLLPLPNPLILVP